VQDIAVDGWAVEMLERENSSYASTANTIGARLGYGIGTVIFINISSLDFCNKYIYKTPGTTPLITM